MELKKRAIPDYLIGEGRGEDEPGEEDGRRRVRPRRELERDQLVRDVVVLLRVGHRTERLKQLWKKIYRWRLKLSLIIFTATASYHCFILQRVAFLIGLMSTITEKIGWEPLWETLNLRPTPA